MYPELLTPADLSSILLSVDNCSFWTGADSGLPAKPTVGH